MITISGVWRAGVSHQNIFIGSEQISAFMI